MLAEMYFTPRDRYSAFGRLRTAESFLLLCLVSWSAVGWAQPIVTIGQNFTASTFNVDSSAVPPDSNGAAGPQHFVELINGRFSVFDKSTGAKLITKTDVSFWNAAGISIASGWDVTDPRLIYDPVSQRWFASQIDFDPTMTINTNHFLLAVSATSDPTGAWHGFSITPDPGNNNFADFPTLGLDGQGVYISGDMFDINSNPVGPSLVSLAKSGLLASPPVLLNLTRFGTMSYNTRGDILQPATCIDGSGQGNVLSVSSVGLDVSGNFVTTNTLVTCQVLNPAGSGAATLSAPVFPVVPSYTVPFNPTQPDGSTNLDDGDARLSAKVYEVGGVLYAVHNTEVNNLAALRWYRINAATQTVLESGTITDPVMDLFYPSIAANASGTVVIAYNGSSINTFPSSFAVVGTTVKGVTTFGTPLLLKAGTASYQNVDTTGASRWGDYSATCVDPSDPTRFWTIQEIATGRRTWSTQVTELLTTLPSPPSLTFTASPGNLALSWTVAGFRLQTTPNLANPTWVPITQNLSTNNGVVATQIPLAGASGFFRLVTP